MKIYYDIEFAILQNNIGVALNNGLRVRRASWPPGSYIIKEDSHIKLHLPNGVVKLWNPVIGDVLESDWFAEIKK